MGVVEDFIRSEALARGIDPDIAVRVARSEGGTSDADPARRGTFPTGSSWWPFQLHYGGTGYEYLGTVAGMGNDFTALTGWEPGDPAAWRDSVRFALDAAAQRGWSPWYGARHVGIGDWDGISWNGHLTDDWDYQKVAGKHPKALDHLRLRSAPGLSGSILQVLDPGTYVSLDPDAERVDQDGHSWRKVYTGVVGWVAEEYLG